MTIQRGTTYRGIRGNLKKTLEGMNNELEALDSDRIDFGRGFF
jgi:hypothetical protein